MRPSILRSLLVVAASFLFPVLAWSQVPTARPSPEQTQILMQTRPDLVAQLRQRFVTSGLSHEQIRARLRAEGYPEDLLDAYLPGTVGNAPMPTDDVFRAVRALGIADSADVVSLQRGALGQRGQGDDDRLSAGTGYGSYGLERDDVARTLAGCGPSARQGRRGSSGSGQGPYGIGSGSAGSSAGPRQGQGQIQGQGQNQNQGQGQGQGQQADGARGPARRPDDGFIANPAARDSSSSFETEADSGFTIFGLSLFRCTTSQFDPNVSGPVDSNYRLGPGDRLVLILTGDVEASYEMGVTREGFVVIPQVGQIFVTNLSLGQLDQVLYSRLSRVYSGIRFNNQGSTRFSVSVSRLRSNQVYVVGDVERPGSYMVSSAGTALTALYAAGGPTDNGSLRAVEVRRGGRTVDVLDVYDYLLRGDASHDVRLQTGDVLFVPLHGPRVRIVGEVVRPATYELRGSETLADLLRSAGGFRPTASVQRILIDRILPAAERTGAGRDRVTMDVSSSAMLATASAGAPLRDGDVVRIFPIADRVRNRIAVEGNVYQAGSQGFAAGMRLSDALRNAGIKPDTYLGEVLITRLRSDSTRQQLRATLADSTGLVVTDLLLQEDDRIQVFSLSSFRPVRFVAIGGAVRKGGRFAYREGMTMRDLVLLADGLQEGASLTEAEIARMPETRAGGRTATTIRVPLDSTFLFERGPNGEYAGPPGVPVPAGRVADVALKPYDNVLILRQTGWSLQRTVVVQGEVKFPGAYALTTKSERLSDLIQRAGGLTDEAYGDGIVFTRRENGIGRVGVELSNALRRYESADNLILRDGDNISVPPYNAVVTIRGQVNAPSTVAYVRGRGIDYYIGAAGGPTHKADEDHAFVTQPSGKLETVRTHLLLPDAQPKPRPGSVVTVPERDPANKRDNVALLTSIAQIVGSTVAIIIAVTR